MVNELQRDASGELPAFSSIGGYPLVYLTDSGLTLCAACASKPADDFDVSEVPSAADVHWEGDPIVCYDCGGEIESAYGPVD